MRAFVKKIAFGGEQIIRPNLLDMNERALPLAEKKMLERGERKQLVFVVHRKARTRSSAQLQ